MARQMTKLGSFLLPLEGDVDVYHYEEEDERSGGEAREWVQLDETHEDERCIMDLPVQTFRRIATLLDLRDETRFVERIQGKRYTCTVLLEYEGEGESSELTSTSVDIVSQMRSEYLEALGIAIMCELSERARNPRSITRAPRTEREPQQAEPEKEGEQWERYDSHTYPVRSDGTVEVPPEDEGGG